MKRKTSVILGSSAIVLVLGILFFINRHKIEKSNFKRNWLDKKVTLLKQIDTLNNVLSLEYFKGSLFINNLTRVVKFDTTGNQKSYYSLANNGLPSYNLLIGFNIDSTGVYLQDTRTRSISKVNFSNKLLYTKKLNEPIFRSCYLSDDKFLIKTGLMSDHYSNEIFSVYDAKSGNEQKYEDLMPKFNTGGIATDGFFIKTKNKILHVYYYMSDIIVFGADGKYIKTFKTIDADNKSPYIITTPEGHSPGPKVQAKHTAGFANDTDLFLCSNVSSRDLSDDQFNSNVIVDNYDLKTGSYKGSFLLPKNNKNLVNSIVFNANSIYTIQGSNILNFYNFKTNEKLAYNSK